MVNEAFREVYILRRREKTSSQISYWYSSSSSNLKVSNRTRSRLGWIDVFYLPEPRVGVPCSQERRKGLLVACCCSRLTPFKKTRTWRKVKDKYFKQPSLDSYDPSKIKHPPCLNLTVSLIFHPDKSQPGWDIIFSQLYAHRWKNVCGSDESQEPESTFQWLEHWIKAN